MPTLDASSEERGDRRTRALLSAAALRHNAALARPADGDEAPVLASDAWGHGAAWVRDVLGDDVIRTGPSGTTLFGLPGAVDGARPVMTLLGRVVSTKPLLRGEGVSYGYTHRAEEDTRVALISGGYAQGIVRMLGNRVEVSIDGRRHRLIGRIAMDVSVADIRDARPARGARVVYFGDPDEGAPSLDSWVHATGWTAAELVSAVGHRAAREVAP